MKNIPLKVSIEGQANAVDSDWFAIQPILAQRGLEQDELINLYLELSANLKVSTRGLSLARIKPSSSIDGVIREVTYSTNDYVGMVV